MTPHDHTTIVPGCYRCEIGQDEALDARLLDVGYNEAVADIVKWLREGAQFFSNTRQIAAREEVADAIETEFARED